jgi:hypothetical protein
MRGVLRDASWRPTTIAYCSNRTAETISNPARPTCKVRRGTRSISRLPNSLSGPRSSHRSYPSQNLLLYRSLLPKLGHPGCPQWTACCLEPVPLKLLGRLEGHRFQPAHIAISAHCNRVNTVEGHLEAISVRLERKAEVDAVVEALRSFTALPQELAAQHSWRRPSFQPARSRFEPLKR